MAVKNSSEPSVDGEKTPKKSTNDSQLENSKSHVTHNPPKMHRIIGNRSYALVMYCGGTDCVLKTRSLCKILQDAEIPVYKDSLTLPSSMPLKTLIERAGLVLLVSQDNWASVTKKRYSKRGLHYPDMFRLAAEDKKFAEDLKQKLHFVVPRGFLHKVVDRIAGGAHKTENDQPTTKRPIFELDNKHQWFIDSKYFNSERSINQTRQLVDFVRSNLSPEY